MNEHQPSRTEQGEREPHATPRLYVASLSDYNNGSLHGIWVDATSEPDDVHAAVQAMLAASPTDPQAEEIAVHDHENYGPYRVGEYEPLDTLLRIGKGIADHGPAFAHWATVVDPSDPDALDQFTDAYRGHWPSLAAYAEELLTETESLTLDGIPDWIQPYVRIDWHGLGDALASDLLTSDGDGGVYLFDT